VRREGPLLREEMPPEAPQDRLDLRCSPVREAGPADPNRTMCLANTGRRCWRYWIVPGWHRSRGRSAPGQPVPR
jgi:hypothetical protein